MKTILDYVKELKEASDVDWQKRNFKMEFAPTYDIEPGSKFIRVVQTSGYPGHQRCVHCFVDKEGNIYKAASWKTPAKGIRGNINNDKKPLLGFDFYGFNPNFL